MNLRDLTPWHHGKAGAGSTPAISELHREVDRVFDDFWRGFGGPSLFGGNGSAMAFDVRVDTSEDDKAYHVTAELPGMSEKDVEVTFADNMLTISGEKKEEKEVKEENVHRRERSFGSFRRSFTLPSEVDEAKIAATFKDGVMTIDLPKSKTAQKKAKKITISRGK
ncbi:Hsp20/alpha crystallin family protein [Pelagibius litoralis]|uniref:Hsp20/alpha crystallin family protein n=1 Tax=Pelagibius litoralis TaxID=374515 RepID=A0A967F0S5_9PROT|nr:Hsp20/alpha crystallin family protein [Pelagibius litoralis]NIA70881.1 Hsp20/alpha crystallin family protein [Pelagibius litoralis]